MNTENAFTKGRSLIVTIIDKMHGIGKCQGRFIREILLLALTMPSRLNFLQMGRYGNLGELTGDKSLVDHYAEVVVTRAAQLVRTSSIQLAAGYFAKEKFVDAICKPTEMELICRMRDDANLNYLY